MTKQQEEASIVAGVCFLVCSVIVIVLFVQQLIDKFS